MRAYAIFGAGFLSGAVLMSGIFLVGTNAGKIVYTSPNISTASVLVGGENNKVSDTPSGVTLDDKEDAASVEKAEEISSEETLVEVESNSVKTPSSSDYITELQERVESLIEQVSVQTTESVAERGSDSNNGEDFFITPTGVKIDAYGNIIDESASEGGDTAQEEETQQLEPGVFITPSGAKIDEEGNVIE